MKDKKRVDVGILVYDRSYGMSGVVVEKNPSFPNVDDGGLAPRVGVGVHGGALEALALGARELRDSGGHSSDEAQNYTALTLALAQRHRVRRRHWRKGMARAEALTLARRSGFG